MIQQPVKIYFGREILNVLREGDLVESRTEFPLIRNSRAVYIGLKPAYKKRKREEGIAIIGRPESDRKDKKTSLIGLRFNLEDISLIGSRIINSKGDYDKRRAYEIIAELITNQSVWLFDKRHKDYDSYYKMLRRHNL